jgi:hypothetical protein
MIKKRTLTDGLPLLRSADCLEMMDGIDCHRCARQSSPDSGFTQKPRTGSRRWLFSFVHSLKFHLARSQMKKAPAFHAEAFVAGTGIEPVFAP